MAVVLIVESQNTKSKTQKVLSYQEFSSPR